MTISNHVFPETINEMLSHLKEPGSKILAGGTGLALMSSGVDTLVDLQQLKLSYIKTDKEKLLVGGMTSSYDIFRHEEMPASLRKAADSIGDLPLLHGVTIGGNLAILYPWVDLPPMLWALNARITLYDPEERKFSADEFFAYSDEQSVGNRNALITEIEIPKTPPNSFADYQTLTLIGNEKAQLNLATNFTWDVNKVITQANMIVSAAVRFPRRLECEKIIVGSTIDDELIERAVESVENEAIVPNYKSSKEYRREVLGVYVKRALKKCQEVMEN